MGLPVRSNRRTSAAPHTDRAVEVDGQAVRQPWLDRTQRGDLADLTLLRVEGGAEEVVVHAVDQAPSVWPPLRAALLVTEATRGRCFSRGGLRPTEPTFTSTGDRATLDTPLSPSSRIGVVAASATAEEQARRAFVLRDQDPPPRFRLSCWQLFCAPRNAGELRSIPLEGLILRPCEVGSGKFGTPCARMHTA